MRKPLLAIVTAFAGLGLVAATALPALAVDTVVTFSITTAGITISAPGTANLGSVATGATSISGQIGPVTVTDDRATLNGSWTATAISTDFTTGAGSPAETIGNINVTYSAGAATTTTGEGTFTPGPGGIINVPRVAFTGTTLVGDNTATWNPTLTVTIPAAAVGGTYSGTVTQSVG